MDDARSTPYAQQEPPCSDPVPRRRGVIAAWAIGAAHSEADRIRMNFRLAQEWYAATSLEDQLYFQATYYMLAAMLGFFGPWDLQWVMQAALLAGSLAGAGFLVWCLPPLLLTWQRPTVRRLMWLVHLGVLVVATGLARWLMTDATGLPGQDFTLAVSALSLAMYPLAWICITMLAMGLAAIVLQVVLFLPLIGHMLYSSVRQSLNRSPPSTAELMTTRRAGRFIGAVALLFVVAEIGTAVVALQPTARWIGLHVAYFGDYQEARSYPGIVAGNRVLMHENGVYSTAKRGTDGSLNITVGKWPSPDSAEPIDDPAARQRLVRSPM